MKTHPVVIKSMQEKMRLLFGRVGGVIFHDPTPENTLGQSGIHTLVDDIMDICKNEPREAWKKLHYLFLGDDL